MKEFNFDELVNDADKIKENFRPHKTVIPRDYICPFCQENLRGKKNGIMYGNGKIRAHEKCYTNAVISDPSGDTLAWYKCLGLSLSETKENYIFHILAEIQHMINGNITDIESPVIIEDKVLKKYQSDNDIIYENDELEKENEDCLYEREKEKRNFTYVSYEQIEKIVHKKLKFNEESHKKIFIDVVTFLHNSRNMNVEQAIIYAQKISDSEYSELVRLADLKNCKLAEKNMKSLLEVFNVMTQEEIDSLSELDKALIRKDVLEKSEKTKTSETLQKKLEETILELSSYPTEAVKKAKSELIKCIFSPMIDFVDIDKENMHIEKREKINIIFKNISEKDRMKWSYAIRAAIDSLPALEQSVVPDIYVYRTMLESFVDKFDIHSSIADEVARFMYSNGAWAYARLTDDDLFISFSIKRFEKLKEFIPPEFTFFHEFGHYQISKRFDEQIEDFGLDKIELKADRYGLFALIRMLDNNMEYKTISSIKKQKDFMNLLKELIAKNVKPAMSRDEKCKIYSEIVTSVFEIYEWEKIYKFVI